MRAFLRQACAALLLSAGASAQIKLGLEINPATLLEYEPVIARLAFLNNTGERLDLGSNGNCRIRYVLRDHAGRSTPRLTPDAIAWHSVIVEPSLSLVLTNRLNDLYQLNRAGSHTVEVEVEWGGLSFSPRKKFLDVVPGITVGELEAGVPGGRGVRRCLLKVLNRERQDRLFLRMEDPAAEVCYGVFDLGRFLRMEDPTLRVDGRGFLHVLHRSGPYENTYTVFSPDGLMDRREVYSGEYKLVRLKTMNDGAVVLKESEDLSVAPRQPKSLRDDLPAGRRDPRKKE